MYYIGVDPGCPHTMVMVNKDHKLVAIARDETVAEKKEINRDDENKPPLVRWSHDFSKSRYVLKSWVDYAKARNIPVTVTMENVGAMPNQGLTSMSKLVSCVAYHRAVFELWQESGYIMDFVFITPQQWKRVMRRMFPEILETKEHSRLLVRRYFSLDDKLIDATKRKKDHDVAEAFILAMMGREFGSI